MRPVTQIFAVLVFLLGSFSTAAADELSELSTGELQTAAEVLGVGEGEVEVDFEPVYGDESTEALRDPVDPRWGEDIFYYCSDTEDCCECKVVIVDAWCKGKVKQVIFGVTIWRNFDSQAEEAGRYTYQIKKDDCEDEEAECKTKEDACTEAKKKVEKHKLTNGKLWWSEHLKPKLEAQTNNGERKDISCYLKCRYEDCPEKKEEEEKEAALMCESDYGQPQI